jgi:hypothetical protein
LNGATTFSIMTLSIKELFATLSKNDIQHESHSTSATMQSVIVQNVTFYFFVMLSAIMLNVVRPDVMAPFGHDE